MRLNVMLHSVFMIIHICLAFFFYQLRAINACLKQHFISPLFFWFKLRINLSFPPNFIEMLPGF